MIDKAYTPSASPDDKRAAKEELEKGFAKALDFVSALDSEGAEIAQEARKKFNGRLYDIFKNANNSSSKFSVLCHGFPIASNIHFLYNEDKRPADVKLTG